MKRLLYVLLVFSAVLPLSNVIAQTRMPTEEELKQLEEWNKVQQERLEAERAGRAPPPPGPSNY